MGNSNSDETDFSFFKNKKKHRDEVDKLEGGVRDKVDAPLEAVKRPVAADTDHYKISNDNIGIALIFDHKVINGQTKRRGTQRDRSRISEVYKSYGFDVRMYQDLTYTEIEEILIKASEEDHSNNDCFVVTVMSHGLTGKVFAKDMAYPVENLWNPFLGNKCPSLVSKPKLFFIQACRGEKLDKGVQFRALARSLYPTDAASASQVTYTIPTTADLLVMYSTFEGNYSWRNPANGSWFIQCLADELEVSVANTDGTDMFYLLTSVARRVAYQYQSNVPVDKAMDQMKQMPSFVSTLTKVLILKRKLKSDKIKKNSIFKDLKFK